MQIKDSEILLLRVDFPFNLDNGVSSNAETSDSIKAHFYQSFYLGIVIGYFQDHAQCVISHVLKISRKIVTLTKQWEINNAHDDEKTLKKEIYTFFLKSVIIVRHCGPPKEWELIAKLRSAFPPVRLTIWGEGGV